MKTVIYFLALTSALLSDPADAGYPMSEAETESPNLESNVSPDILFISQEANNNTIEIQRREAIPPLSSTEFLNFDYSSKKFLYGSLSLDPGGGISYRNRDGLKGTAIDWKVGVLPFAIDTIFWRCNKG